jgi:hypothetical protein
MPAAFTVQLDDATVGAFDRLAQNTGRTPDSLVAEAVQDYLALKKDRIRHCRGRVRRFRRRRGTPVRAKFLPQP